MILILRTNVMNRYQSFFNQLLQLWRSSWILHYLIYIFASKGKSRLKLVALSYDIYAYLVLSFFALFISKNIYWILKNHHYLNLSTHKRQNATVKSLGTELLNIDFTVSYSTKKTLTWLTKKPRSTRARILEIHYFLISILMLV